MYYRTSWLAVSNEKPTQSRNWRGMGSGLGLTFSRPKNLSLPSFRKGPAFCSIFSSGVSSRTGSSFFFCASLLPLVDPPYPMVSDTSGD